MEYSRYLDKARGQTFEKILDYLFLNCDTIYFHAEDEREHYFQHNDDNRNDDFDAVIKNVFKEEMVVNCGMNVLRISLKPTEEVKNFLYKYGISSYYYSRKKHYAPYLQFADVAFSQNGKLIVSCLTHEGFFDVDPTFSSHIQSLYFRFIRLEPDFLEIETKVKVLQDYYLSQKRNKDFIRLIKKNRHILSLIDGTTRHFNFQFKTGGLTKEEYSLEKYKQTVQDSYPAKLYSEIAYLRSWGEINDALLEKLDNSYNLYLDVVSKLIL